MPKFVYGALALVVRISVRFFRFIASCIRLRSISAAIWIDAYDNAEGK